jgi:hypothetical protein
MKKSRERGHLIISYLQHICEKRLAALLLFQMREITPPSPPPSYCYYACGGEGRKKGIGLARCLMACLSASLPVCGLDMSASLLADMVAKQLTQIVPFLLKDCIVHLSNFAAHCSNLVTYLSNLIL